MIEHLRALREDNDLTQQTLAEYLNVSQTTYSDYEHGKINIPRHSLMKLAEYFDTSIDYLLGLTDEPKPYPRAKKKRQD